MSNSSTTRMKSFRRTIRLKIAKLSYDLHEEICKCTKSSTISKRLREALESYSREIRRKIVQRMRGGCPPLFIACRRGCVSIAEYLVKICEADIEQKGLFEAPEDGSYYLVTPLWCAAVSNNIPLVKFLLRVGSDINATSDTGSTPVRSACYMNHIEMVKFLVENGADIKKTNMDGGTCLINSVKSPDLCLFLIRKGCDINAVDNQGKTALHYAIQEHRLETIKLLLEHGLNPYAVSRHGDDALRTACLRGDQQIFDYLSNNLKYSNERLAEAHELIGSTFLNEYNESWAAISHWHLAHQLRASQRPYIEKLPKAPLREAYRFKSEFTTLEELDNIARDMDDMQIQSFLICERILGITHKDTLSRLLFCGASYIDSLQIQRCIQLWTLLLKIRVQHNTLLFFETSFAAQALVRLMLELNQRNRDFGDETLPHFNDVLTVYTLLTETVSECHALLQIRPISWQQQKNFDSIFQCIAYTIYLLIIKAQTPNEKRTVFLAVKKLVQANITSACTNDSLLHVCLSRLIVVKSGLLSNEDLNEIFPHAGVIKLLLECGINVNAKNDDKSTPLHIAAQQYNFNNEIIKIILDHGADLYQPNKSDERPYNLISLNSTNTIPLINYTNLKSLAAIVISKYRIPYNNNQIPKSLENFVKNYET